MPTDVQPVLENGQSSNCGIAHFHGESEQNTSSSSRHKIPTSSTAGSRKPLGAGSHAPRPVRRQRETQKDQGSHVQTKPSETTLMCHAKARGLNVFDEDHRHPDKSHFEPLPAVSETPLCRVRPRPEPPHTLLRASQPQLLRRQGHSVTEGHARCCPQRSPGCHFSRLRAIR